MVFREGLMGKRMVFLLREGGVSFGERVELKMNFGKIRNIEEGVNSMMGRGGKLRGRR